MLIWHAATILVVISLMAGLVIQMVAALVFYEILSQFYPYKSGCMEEQTYPNVNVKYTQL